MAVHMEWWLVRTKNLKRGKAKWHQAQALCQIGVAHAGKQAALGPEEGGGTSDLHLLLDDNCSVQLSQLPTRYFTAASVVCSTLTLFSVCRHSPKTWPNSPPTTRTWRLSIPEQV